MSAGEIVISTLTVIGLLLGILRVWIQSQTQLEQLKTQIESIRERLNKDEKALETHIKEDEERFREFRQETAETLKQFRTENREDHRLIFKKIDELKK